VEAILPGAASRQRSNVMSSPRTGPKLHHSSGSSRFLIAAAALAVTAPAAVGQVLPGNITIGLQEVASGLTSPVFATSPVGDSSRLFVADQTGRIRIIENGSLLATPFLDLSATIPVLNTGFDERGLLGLAFHPNYANNGRFFVRYSVPRQGAPGEPCFGTPRGCHTEVLSEFSVSGNPNVANPTPSVLFQVDKPQFNHNAGQVMFGPDGYLYFSLGDGGGAHDGLADNPPSHGPIGNGQNIEAVLGKLHRIDVDSAPAPGLAYAIPPTNPFVGVPGRDEIYAFGFRNPYRFSFDDGPGGTNQLYLGDVGQNRFEEVDIVQLGGNYGWVIREGFHCFDPFNPNTPPAVCPTTGAGGEPLLDPIAEYDHTDGISVIGGFVYRGSAFPELQGKYVFGEFSRTFAPANGRILFIDTDGTLSEVFEFQLDTGLPLGRYVLGLGRDANGELYLLTSNNLGPTGATGRVFRIIPEPAALTLMLSGGMFLARRRRRST